MAKGFVALRFYRDTRGSADVPRRVRAHGIRLGQWVHVAVPTTGSVSSAPNTPPTWKRSTVGPGRGPTNPTAGDTHSAPWPTTRPNTTRPYSPRKPRSAVLTCKPGLRLSGVLMQQEPGRGQNRPVGGVAWMAMGRRRGAVGTRLGCLPPLRCAPRQSRWCRPRNPARTVCLGHWTHAAAPTPAPATSLRSAPSNWKRCLAGLGRILDDRTGATA